MNDCGAAFPAAVGETDGVDEDVAETEAEASEGCGVGAGVGVPASVWDGVLEGEEDGNDDELDESEVELKVCEGVDDGVEDGDDGGGVNLEAILVNTQLLDLQRFRIALAKVHSRYVGRCGIRRRVWGVHWCREEWRVGQAIQRNA